MPRSFVISEPGASSKSGPVAHNLVLMTLNDGPIGESKPLSSFDSLGCGDSGSSADRFASVALVLGGGRSSLAACSLHDYLLDAQHCRRSRMGVHHFGSFTAHRFPAVVAYQVEVAHGYPRSSD